MMMNGMDGMMGGMMWFWGLVWLLFAALLVVGIVVLVRTLGGDGAGHPVDEVGGADPGGTVRKGQDRPGRV